MQEIKLFRSLIVASLLSLILATWFSYNGPTPNEEVAYLYRWSGYGAVVPGIFGNHLWHVWLFLTVCGLVGSFFFVRAVRPVLILPIVISAVRAGLGGIYVSSGAEDAVWTVYYLFSTLVLGMALFSEPIKARFNPKKAA